MREALGTRLTIREVARVAGVGLGTVSRVLNGSDVVSKATREHVQAVIERLGYRPNAHARRFSRKQADSICFVLCNRAFLHPFHARIFQGVESAAKALKRHVVFVTVDHRKEQRLDEISLPLILEERGWVDGLILAGFYYPNFIARIKVLGVPFVTSSNHLLVPRSRTSFDQVRYDGRQGEFQAARYLIDRGHRSIAFVGDTQLPWMREQERGYLQAMRGTHLSPIEITTHRETSGVEYGQWAASQLLSRRPRPTAVLAGNDSVAFGLWRVFRRQSVRVPQDISLVGFDDTEEALLVDPPLTTVRVPKENIGLSCVQVLMQRLSNPDAPFNCLVLPTQMALRKSVRSLNKEATNVGTNELLSKAGRVQHGCRGDHTPEWFTPIAPRDPPLLGS